MLSDTESDGETLRQLTINEHFAKAYARKKEREELGRLKEKYGSDAEIVLDESEDSEDTDEDEDGEELTPTVDAAILRTLARIKRKDPDIYDSKKDVFEEEQQKTRSSFSFNTKKEEKSKPLHLRQHMLQSQLQPTSRSPSPEPVEPTHVEEQAALRKETISVFHSAVSQGHTNADDGDDDDILIPREKTKDEIEHEEEEYRAFLAREVGEDIGGLVSIERGEGSSVEGGKSQDRDEQEAEEKGKVDKKKKKKRKERKSKEQEDHEFLMSYILNRGWIDKSAHRVPKYEEVTGSKSQKKGKAKEDDDDEEENDSRRIDVVANAASDYEAENFDEEEFDEVAETFESSYNFRFEEPNATEIATHPREISSTVRREENPRKAARERKKQRKEEKLLQKREEVKRLKALKMKEMREKLERIGKEGGKSADDEALQQLDLEGDWDPEAHDRQMAGIYGEDEPQGEEDVDLEKPTWDDDIDITDIVPPEPEPQPEAGPSEKRKKDKKKKKKKGDDADEEEDGVDADEMDADLPTNSNSKLSKKVPDSEMDDVYALEFNDLVGDIPTRFKYTPVLPDSYGLSATEILLADDAELNNLVGLRKVAAPYRKDRGRAWDPKRGEKLKEFRKKLGESSAVGGAGGGGEGGSLNGNVEGEGEGAGMKGKRKGKKERQKAKLTTAIMSEEDPSSIPQNDKVGREEIRTEVGGEPPAKKRKRRHKGSGSALVGHG
ncbi:KRI1 [Sanghuangporus sanghuang]